MSPKAEDISAQRTLEVLPGKTRERDLLEKQCKHTSH